MRTHCIVLKDERYPRYLFFLASREGWDVLRNSLKTKLCKRESLMRIVVEVGEEGGRGEQLPTFLVSRWRRWRGSRPWRPCPPPPPSAPPAAPAAKGDIIGGVTPSSSSSLAPGPQVAGSLTSSLGGGGRAIGGWNQDGTGRGVGFKPGGFVSGFGAPPCHGPGGPGGQVGVPGPGHVGAFL